jgi:hypothetical protein
MRCKRPFSRRKEVAPDENSSQRFSPPRLISLLLTLPFSVPDAAAQVPCATPPAQLQGKLTTWKQGATIHVMIDPTFSPTQEQAIKDQFNKWKNAGGANITFKFVEPSQAGGGATTGGPPILSVMRQVPDKLGPTAQGETEGFSYRVVAGILSSISIQA